MGPDGESQRACRAGGRVGKLTGEGGALPWEDIYETLLEAFPGWTPRFISKEMGLPAVLKSYKLGKRVLEKRRLSGLF